MPPTVPWTPLASYYKELKEGKSGLKRHLAEADRLIADPSGLVDLFVSSVEASDEFFSNHPRSENRFYDKPREPDRVPSLADTDSIGRLFLDHPKQRWAVSDDALSFYFVDRELVVTRAPGFRLERKSASPISTRFGPRLDLLLRNADDGTPILGEVKVERDKDPFFGLVQVLLAASYMQPAPQQARLLLHDQEFAPAGPLDVYLVLATEPGDSKYWFELRDRAETLAAAVGPQLRAWVRRIAAIELLPSEDTVSGPLLIEKRWAV